MPILKNQRYERFAQELAKGRSALEAYEIAGYKPNRGNASVLKANPIISGRVAELQTRMVAEVVLTKEWIIEQLIENVKKDKENGSGAVANKALELLGREKGMFIERREVGEPGDFDRLADAELWQRLRADAAELGISFDELPAPGETEH
jgi:phage terminase small subunit